MSIIKKGIGFLVLFLLLFIFFPNNIYAVILTVSNVPASISSEPFDISVSVSGAQDGNNFLRIDLYKEGTTNYFGDTFNGTDWYGGSSGTSYFQVSIVGATASATLKGRVGNPSNNEYPGPGLYKLRVRRYTASGNPAGSDEQTPADVNITYIAPTPTPEPTQASTEAPTVAPTPTKTATPTLTKTPTPKPSATPLKTKLPTPTSTSVPEVLGETVQTTPETKVLANENESTEEKKKIPLTAFIFIGGGAFFLLGAFVSYFKIRKNEKKI